MTVKREGHPCPPAGFEPAILASERPHSDALGRAGNRPVPCKRTSAFRRLRPRGQSASASYNEIKMLFYWNWMNFYQKIMLIANWWLL